MAVSRIYCATGTTGGGTGDLDSIYAADLADKDMAIVMDQTNVYFYVWDDDNSDAESGVRIIDPDDNTGNGRWVLQSLYVEDVTLVVDDIIVGDDLTVTGDSEFKGTVQIGDADGTGSDLTVYSDTAGDTMVFDASAKTFTITDVQLIANNIDINDGGDGAIDGVIIGAATAAAGTFTTCDATTDFTVGNLVLTSNTITNASGGTPAELTIAAGGVLVTGSGGVYIGDAAGNATAAATLYMYPDTETYGGKIYLYTANDSDDYINRWEINPINDDLFIGPNGNTDAFYFLGNGANADPGCTYVFTVNGTFAGTTIADLGTVTTANIDGGTIDGTTIGAASATTIIGTTIDATTDFTIDGLVITADTITNDATLNIKYSTETMAVFAADGAVTLYYDNVAKFATTTDGITTAGTIGVSTSDTNLTLAANGTGVIDINDSWNAASQTCSDLGTVTTADIDGGTIDGTTVGTNSAAAGNFTSIGATTSGTIVGTTIDATTDFTIDGLVITADTITNDATLTIKYSTESMAEFAANGAVTLYYDNGAKFATTSTGITTAGTIGVSTADTNLTLAANGTGVIDINDSWNAASQTCSDLGTVTTADIDGGTIDGATIGAASANTIVGTTIDATTDFTIGGLVITANQLATDGTLTIAGTAETLATFVDDGAVSLYYDNVITFATTTAGITVGDGTDSCPITYANAGDTLTFTCTTVDIDGASTATTYDADTDFTVGNTVITDNQIAHTGLTITGGTVTINGTSETLATFTDDGACVLYNNNVAVLSTTAAGISITDGTATAATIGFSSDDLYITNNDLSGNIYIQCYDASTLRNAIVATAGEVTLYAGSVAPFKTNQNGIQIGATNTNVYISGANGGDAEFSNDETSGHIKLTAKDAVPAKVTMFEGDPDGPVDLYYDGGKKFSTTAAGISITDGAATAATIGFSSDDLVIDNNDVAGLIILKGEKTGPSEVTMASFNPDGAAELYYAGTIKLATTTDGITTAGTIGVSTTDTNLTLAANGTGVIDINDSWNAASQTCSDLGTVTTADIDGGTIDGATIGASSANTIIGTTIDATTDFTIGGTVITDGQIADDGTFSIVGTGETMATFTDDGAVSLYYNNLETLRTYQSSNDYGVFVGQNSTVGATENYSKIYQVISNGGLMFHNTYHNGYHQFQIQNSGGSTINTLQLKETGTSIYNSNEAIIVMATDGFYIRNGGDQTSWQHQVLVTNADYYIDGLTNSNEIFIRGKDSGGNLDNIFHGDPNGPVDLYYAGTKEAETISGGLKATNGFTIAAEQTITSFTGADLALVTGTAGGASTYAMWNGDGDLVEATGAAGGGSIGFGVDDDTPGTVHIYGGGNTEAGGTLNIYNPADQDTDTDYWQLKVVANTNDLYIGSEDAAVLTLNGGATPTLTVNQNSTFASTTIANLGTVTTADIDGGSIDGTTIGAASASTAIFTTCDATSDFTIDGLVLTADTITNDAALSIVAPGITLKSDENALIFTDDGSVAIYHNNVKTFETNTAGINIGDGTDSCPVTYANVGDTLTFTCATVDIDGASTATTYDADTDFTVGGTVITDSAITDTGLFAINSASGLIVTDTGAAGSDTYLYVGTGDSIRGIIHVRADDNTSGPYIEFQVCPDQDGAGTTAWNIDQVDNTDDLHIGCNNDTSMLQFLGGATPSIVIDCNWTATGETCADLGAVTTADINGGTMDGVTIGANTLGSTSLITTSYEPSSDETANGLVISGTVDQNTYGYGGVLMLTAGDGNWDDADKDAASTAAVMIGMVLGDGTGTKNIMLQGIVRQDAWAWTAGQAIYIGDSGAPTNDVSGYTTDDVVRLIGYALTDDCIWFCPSMEWTVVA